MSPDLIRRFVGARAIETVPRMTETRAHRGLAVGTRDERGRGGYERGGGGACEKEGGILLSRCMLLRVQQRCFAMRDGRM